MKKKLLLAIFAIMLASSCFDIGGQFFKTPLQAAEYIGGDTYTYEYNGRVFQSNLSEDDAFTKAMIDQVNQSNLTMEDVNIIYSSFGSRDTIEIPQLITPMRSVGESTGQVQWQPDTGAEYIGGDTYTYEYNGRVYQSNLSEDDAFTKAMIDQVNQGNLTMEDVNIIYSSFGGFNRFS